MRTEEKKAIRSIFLGIVEHYCAARGIPEGRLASDLAGDARLFNNLRGGKNIYLDTAVVILAQIDDHCPEIIDTALSELLAARLQRRAVSGAPGANAYIAGVRAEKAAREGGA